LNPDQIANLEEARQVIQVVLNLVEELKQENAQLRAEVQHLRAEVRRLKGEQGQPAQARGRPFVGAGAETEIAGVSRAEFIDALSRFGITPFQYSVDEVLLETGTGESAHE